MGADPGRQPRPRPSTSISACTDIHQNAGLGDRPGKLTACEKSGLEAALRSNHHREDARVIAGVLSPLLPKVEDRAVKLLARAALAQYVAAVGNERSAETELRSVIEKASEQGYRLSQLEAELALAEIDTNPKERRRVVEDVERNATALGLTRMARDAAQLQLATSIQVPTR